MVICFALTIDIATKSTVQTFNLKKSVENDVVFCQGPSLRPLRQRMRVAALKSLSAISAAVSLQPRAIDKQSLARLHTLFINSPSVVLLLPSGVRSPYPGLAPKTCPNLDLNQTVCNTLVKEAA